MWISEFPVFFFNSILPILQTSIAYSITVSFLYHLNGVIYSHYMRHVHNVIAAIVLITSLSWCPCLDVHYLLQVFLNCRHHTHLHPAFRTTPHRTPLITHYRPTLLNDVTNAMTSLVRLLADRQR